MARNLGVNKEGGNSYFRARASSGNPSTGWSRGDNGERCKTQDEGRKTMDARRMAKDWINDDSSPATDPIFSCLAKVETETGLNPVQLSGVMKYKIIIFLPILK